MGRESVEITVRTRKLYQAGTLIRMSGSWLPKRIVFRNLDNEVRRGRGGKEKEWIDYVQIVVRVFDIARASKATAFEAGVWVETVTEEGERFMVALGKKEKDSARHRQERIDTNETRKVVIVQGSVEPPKRHRSA